MAVANSAPIFALLDVFVFNNLSSVTQYNLVDYFAATSSASEDGSRFFQAAFGDSRNDRNARSEAPRWRSAADELSENPIF